MSLLSSLRPSILALILGATALAACSDDDAEPTPSASPRLTWVSHLDPARGQLPEGLALNASGDTAFVGLAPTGEILAVKLSDGSSSSFGSVPPLPPGEGYLLGLALDSKGNVFAGVASSNPGYRAGIYRVPASGGAAELFASHEGLYFPNALTFDEAGAMLVSDSLMGAIFKVSPAGEVSLWVTDAALKGDTNGPCANGAGFPIGANGLVLSKGEVFVVNTDHGALLKIPVRMDGSAGEVSTLVPSNCSLLGGADGMTMGSNGKLMVAANAINAITEVSTDGVARVLISGGDLDFPASVSVSQAGNKSVLLITNAALKSSRDPKATPRPGLLKLPLE